MNMFEQFAQLSYPWYALVVGITIGSVCSLLSVLVVLKRMAFIGQGISHAGFGGIGTAALLGLVGWQQDIVVLIFCLSTAWVIGAMVRSRRIETDAAIGILLAATMAWGMLAQNLRIWFNDMPWYRELIDAPLYRPSWESILFGSILSVSEHHMIAAAVVMVLVLGWAAWRYPQLVFFCFDQNVSAVHGIRPGRLFYMILFMISLVVVVAIQLVGLILASALLIIPGAAGLMLSKKLNRVLIWAWVIGVGSCVSGLLLSLQIGRLATGPCIVAILIICFAMAWAVGRYRFRTPRRPQPPANTMPET